MSDPTDAPPAEPGTDLLAAVLQAGETYGPAPAITFGRHSLSYRELRGSILRTAAALRLLGMQPGDRVLFSIRPGADATVLVLGIIAAGGSVVFADPGAGEATFRARAQLAAARWVAAESVLYLASSAPLRRFARGRGLVLPPYARVVPDARHLYSGPWLPGVPRGSVHVHTLSAPGTIPPEFEPGDPTAEALVIFTSGTTDDPKAVVHSRLSLGTGLGDFVRHTGILPGQRVLTDQLMVGVPALIAGAHWVLPAVGTAPGAQPTNYLDLLPGADVLFAVPAAMDALLTLLESHPERTPTISTVIIGGAPVLRPLLERVRAQLPGARITAIYGMTEMLPVALADGDEKLAYTGEGDYVGQLASTVHARIVDGELVVAGPGLMLGYLGKEPQREVATGDLARIEGDRLVLAGRSKDMFIRGETNVYPGLYEPIIAGLPGVREAALVGVPNAIGDDAIVLVLVPEEQYVRGAGDHPLIAAVRRALPGLIDAAVLPDRILVEPELPRSGRARKLDRAALAELVRARLG
ncbi:class I adenylate-forming enzyme family protein [Galbitalea soli]|uniref:Acyl--CoA ligase n=1 Tax=Galbitalea soli TaxID=1268042 RepID=A0A7C9PM74_9MICO|nr:class I adenylate-forming enzyme family protein [Galbitalea soli]NEM90732.1 acyl--CoA ligase [Galbitalea soli]NYJ31450.1 acyl-CoA synthetase (AMP-forming)/AMP-acid ligase II [Galbitalea soli]